LKRIFLLFAAALFFLTACSGNSGGGQTEETSTAAGQEVTKAQEQTTQEKPIRLPYSSSDSLHPYKAALAMNRQVASLLYDRLYSVDAQYKPQNELADSETLSGLKLTVKLGKAVFSDGTALDAKQVVQSYELAKKSAAYKERLNNFASCTAQGEDTLVFTLVQGDQFATACLDFPIILSGGKQDPPLGSGLYVLKEEQGAPVLTPNPRWRENTEYSAKRLILTNITDPDTIAEGVGIGSISYAMTDLADGKTKSVSARAVQLPMNNLVYLACNNSKKLLSEPKIRQAISLMLDREDLALGAFQGNAHITDTPFNPDWYLMEDKSVAGQKRDAAQKLLEETGATGKQLQQSALTLLVNKENPQKLECARRIMNALQVGGLRVTLKSLSLTEYQAAAKSGSFDLMLAEVRLTNNMALSALFSEGGGAHYGINAAGRSAQAYGEFRRGAISIDEYLEVFAAEMPFVPLLYRGGLSYYDRALSEEPPAAYDADVYAFVPDFKY
jgi:peptide/nickel transport system substrate-binding protein